MGKQEEDIRDILAFQAGDDQAFQRLFERYRRPIMNYLYRFFWNRAIAEELTQEVFLRVCKAAERYEPRTAFRNWIYQIAANVARNEVRKHEYAVKKQPLAGPVNPEEHRPEEIHRDPCADTPEKLVSAQRLEEEIQRVLVRLPDKQRTALLLCRHHGFSYREIAEIMQLRQGAVKSLIHRATETLRKRLRPHLERGSETQPLSP